MIRRGKLSPLAAETLPAVLARQEKLNARFAAAMDHGFVGGDQAPATVHSIVAYGMSAEAGALIAALSRTRRRRK